MRQFFLKKLQKKLINVYDGRSLTLNIEKYGIKISIDAYKDP
jgi:hypothetical protein